MSLQIIIYLCVLICTVVLGKKPRIIGGLNTEIREFPHMVSLRIIKNNQHFCGGSIITDWHILTAANCFFNADDNLDRYRAYTGTSSPFDTSGPAYRLAFIDIHPKYEGIFDGEASFQSDIAILTTRQKIVFNEFQKKIELPTKEIRAGLSAYLTGWGAISTLSSDLPQKLQRALLTILDHDECRKSVTFKLHQEQLCAVQTTGIGACTHDSGSPLTIGDTVVGIASFNFFCEIGKPDIYTDIYNNLDFILPIIKM